MNIDEEVIGRVGTVLLVVRSRMSKRDRLYDGRGARDVGRRAARGGAAAHVAGGVQAARGRAAFSRGDECAMLRALDRLLPQSRSESLRERLCLIRQD